MADLSVIPIDFIESSEWIDYFNSIFLPSENIGLHITFRPFTVIIILLFNMRKQVFWILGVLDRESLLERVAAFGFQQLHFKIAIFSASTHQVCVQNDTAFVSCTRCSTTIIARLFSSCKPLNNFGSTISCHSGSVFILELFSNFLLVWLW